MTAPKASTIELREAYSEPAQRMTARTLLRTIGPNNAQDLERPLAVKDKIVSFLLRFPEYTRPLRLAVVHEESGAGNQSYQGWRWHDVEIHPTKLIRLVTEQIAKINLKTRHAAFYLLRDLDASRRALAMFSLYG